jgi:hypothetical protein
MNDALATWRTGADIKRVVTHPPPSRSAPKSKPPGQFWVGAAISAFGVIAMPSLARRDSDLLAGTVLN